jgi:hypothetical protein
MSYGSNGKVGLKEAVLKAVDERMKNGKKHFLIRQNLIGLY